MTTPLPRPEVRAWDPNGNDATEVARLVTAYLLQTEREKAERLLVPSGDGPLPLAYRMEAQEPRSAYRGAAVHVAELEGIVAGVVVVRARPVGAEIKRLWADPSVRGRGVGSALLDSALTGRVGSVRLSVWDWRGDALRLYASRGFIRVASWDARPRLICMERPAAIPGSQGRST